MLSRLNKYGPVNSIDAWKCFALVTMVIDHLGAFIFPENEYFRAIGRASAPVWLYFAGRHFQSGIGSRIIIYAASLVAALSFLKQELDYDNILISIIIAKLLVRLSDRVKLFKHVHYIAILFAGFGFLLPTILCLEYGSAGWLLAYCGYLHKINYPARKTAVFFAITALIYIFAQQSLLPFLSTAMIIATILVFIVMYLLYRFEFTNSAESGVAANCIKFISRYSLEIYFFHIIVFVAINQHPNF